MSVVNFQMFCFYLLKYFMLSETVGKLSRSQLTQEQVRFYIDEEENRRRNLLQKYIRLCNDAKVRDSACKFLREIFEYESKFRIFVLCAS